MHYAWQNMICSTNYDKDAKKTQWEKNYLFNKWC